jgi:hypothetical protein
MKDRTPLSRIQIVYDAEHGRCNLSGPADVSTGDGPSEYAKPDEAQPGRGRMRETGPGGPAPLT